MDTLVKTPAFMSYFAWQPPAETHLPPKAFLHAIYRKDTGFGEMLRRYLEVNTCILLGGSARCMLTLLLCALSNHSKSQKIEVLIPGYTCYSVAASVVRAGLIPRVYDIDPETFMPDMNSLKIGVRENTLAVITQHLFGIPTPVEQVREVAEEHGVILIEDAAQGLGGRINNKALGTLGDFGIISFGRGKSLPLGAGGALVVQYGESNLEDPFKGEHTWGLRDLGVAFMTQILTTPVLYALMEALPLGLGKTIFDPGFPVKPFPITIEGLGGASLQYLEKLNNHRLLISKVYKENLPGDKMFPITEGAQPVFTRYPVRASSKPLTNNLIRKGLRRMYPLAIADEPAIQPYLAKDGKYTPGASKLADILITLPTHRGISTDHAKAVAGDVTRWMI